MVNKHNVDYHVSSSELISRTQPLIFLWTPKWFISPKSFLRFFLNLHIPPWLQKSCKLMVLRLLANTFVNLKKLNLFILTHASKQNSPLGFYHYPPSRRKLHKIKTTRVLVTSFDKFYHFCNLSIVDFCFVVP